jgi:hypothetical protein
MRQKVCEVQSGHFSVTGIASTESLSVKSISIFPNPLTGSKFFVSGNEFYPGENIVVQLVSLDGKNVMQ